MKLTQMTKTKKIKLFGKNYLNKIEYRNALALSIRRERAQSNKEEKFVEVNRFTYSDKSLAKRQDFFIKKSNQGTFSVKVHSKNNGVYGGFKSYRYEYQLTYNTRLFDIKKIGGVWTLISKSNKKIKKVWTFRITGKNYIVTESGFLFKTLHGSSISEIEEKIKQRSETASKLIRERIEFRIENEKLKKVFVEINDSLKSGNCEIGTNNFIERKFIGAIGPFAVRADYLLNIAGEQVVFVRRAISEAVSRQLITAVN